MFRNKRPALSNRVQTCSSSISVRIACIACVIFRVPPRNSFSSRLLAATFQQAHNGSGPFAEFAATTSARLFAARSVRNLSQSSVRNGMSQLTIRAQSGFALWLAASSKAVTIPPSGPSPGQRSSTIRAPAAAYFPAAATTAASSVTRRNSSIVRSIIDVPWNSTSALSRPKRVLPPPAITYPATQPAFSLAGVSTFPLAPAATALPPPPLSPAFVFPILAASPASYAGAVRSLPPSATRSIGAQPVASSAIPPRTCVLLRGNPAPPSRHLPSPRRSSKRWVLRRQLPPADLSPRSLLPD